MLEIIKYPRLILRTKVKKVKNILNAEVQKFIGELIKTMVAADGLGLAANQVDKNLRMLAINHKDGPKVFINPVIYWKSWKKNEAEEGCLSFPGVYGLVWRSKKIRLFYRDGQNRLRHLAADELLARVLQHETDHLNGVLFIDKATKYTRGENQVKDWQNQATNENI
ncbi:MAG: peptide deformylase [Candidatus Komeilibacteria bacterium]|nr:peptide deformylase [Candidatus Komeilibacteria bacterium]